MRQQLTAVILTFISLLLSGCEDNTGVDLILAADAGIDAVKAVIISDEDVRNMAVETVQFSDGKNRVASAHSSHAQRLQRLTARYVQQGDLQFNFKAYLTPEINAFATADASIRIYSGLMDRMNDSELLFIIGHEMGHVVKGHSRKKIRIAYASRAIRKGAASINNEVGSIARSQIGGFAEKLLNAQYSQKEEKEADDYGLLFLKDTGRDPKAAASALRKLAGSSSSHSFLSSHPVPEKRAKRLLAQLQ
jgi:metalloprotease